MKIHIAALLSAGLMIGAGSAVAQDNLGDTLGAASDPGSIAATPAQQEAIDLYYEFDYSRLDVIDACAETVPACAGAKGEGLFFGDGWEEDVPAAIPYLTRAALAGNTEAMTYLFYLYKDDSMPEYDPALAAKWAGLAVTSETDPLSRELNTVEFFTQPFEQARLFQGWTAFKLPVPVHMSFSVMGENLTKIPVMSDVQAEDLRRAQKALRDGMMTDLDVYTVMQMTARKYGAAMRTYSVMLREGIVVPQDVELADAFLDAAPAWE